MTVLQWWLPDHLAQSCSPSDSAAAAVTSQICHCCWQPAMNNLYEYSSIACAAEPTMCLHCAAEPIVRAIPRPWNLWSDLSQLMTVWCVSWRWQRRGNCCSVIAAAWDKRIADSAGLGQSSATGWFCGDAVTKCHFRLRWHLGPNCGNSIPLASFTHCSFWGENNCMMPKAISFQLCYLLLNSLSLRVFPLGLTCLVPRVINVEDHSADKLKLD